MSWDGLAPELVWGLIPRFVGALYVLGFGSLSTQIAILPGGGDIRPLPEALGRIRADFPGLRRFFEYPTLLWLSPSPATVRVLPWVGVVCGLCAIYGGPVGYCGLLLGWAIWLSLESVGLIFPWDTMLLEAGFLALFLPVAPALPQVHASELPLPSVAFVFRWLVLRLMVGFGKDKFIGATRSDMLYLRGFFVWMPLPTPLGWLGHHAPAWLLRLSLLFMFFAEVIAPVMGLFSGPLRLVAFGALCALMLGIHATGNWGFFNLGYILLCICLLDVHGSIFDLGHEPWASSALQFPDLAVHVVMGLLFLASLPYLPNNSWMSRTWVQWPARMFPIPHRWFPLVAFVHRALAPVRAIAPFRLVNGYGVFPPHSIAAIRMKPVLEGSDDGVTWKQYGYRIMPSFAHSRPPVIAPHHARFDQWTYYVGMGMDTGTLAGSVMPWGNPYLVATRSTWFDIFMQRILAGDPKYVRVLGHNPFPERPPRLLRVGMLAMTPSSLQELRATGNWWRVRRLGTLLPARGLEAWPDRLVIPHPELFHCDFVAIKRRSRALREVERAFAAGDDSARAVIAGSELQPQDVDRFWNELVPALAEARGQWSRVHERATAIEQQFPVEALYRLERVLERFAWLLRIRSEPYRDASCQPTIPVMSNFRYQMVLHEIIIDGRASYEAMLAHPEWVAARAAGTTDATQLWVLTLMRYRQMMVHVCTFRWSELGLQSHEKRLPGLFEYYPFLREQRPPDEEFCPKSIKHDNGEHSIEGFLQPPLPSR